MAIVFLLLASLAVSGCHSQQTAPQLTAETSVNAEAIAEQLRTMASVENLTQVQAANRGNNLQNLHAVYEATQSAPAWIRREQATSQALAVISALEHSQLKGLDPEDYDASLWPARLEALKAARGDAATLARFNVELTVSALRYLSDLRTGRLNPKPLVFGIDLDQRHYDLPQYLVLKVLTAPDVPGALRAVEPQYLGYQRAEAALETYIALAANDRNEPLPDLQQAVKLGDAYSGVLQLGQRLRLLGDLPQDASSVNPNASAYDAAMQEAVKHFQTRHGLKPDGVLDKRTLLQLNTPLSARVLQLRNSLERWRWLPADYPRMPVTVNIPGFRLRVFSGDRHVAMRMNVVVGKAILHQTPAFAKEIKYIVFRPYWNLPPDIVRADVVPRLRRDSRYLARKGFEVTDRNGRIVPTKTVNSATLAAIRSGKLMVRQKPGPSNALGLVKFIFPNEFDIYLHSTPAPQLFSRSRRDFSHGCIRVEKPAELAAWLLRDQPKWTLSNIQDAMQSGPDNQEVLLSTPVPVVIVYLTAVVEEDGEVYFYDDIYGLDKALNGALAKKRPNH
ncbi:MAG: L,D-transpeptidase family protein [Terracidiphilus sp.]|nr:L,D-transpeptidase family protein [Terracidiphilus sp.]